MFEVLHCRVSRSRSKIPPDHTLQSRSARRSLPTPRFQGSSNACSRTFASGLVPHGKPLSPSTVNLQGPRLQDVVLTEPHLHEWCTFSEVCEINQTHVKPCMAVCLDNGSDLLTPTLQPWRESWPSKPFCFGFRSHLSQDLTSIQHQDKVKDYSSLRNQSEQQRIPRRETSKKRLQIGLPPSSNTSLPLLEFQSAGLLNTKKLVYEIQYVEIAIGTLWNRHFDGYFETPGRRLFLFNQTTMPATICAAIKSSFYGCSDHKRTARCAKRSESSSIRSKDRSSRRIPITPALFDKVIPVIAS